MMNEIREIRDYVLKGFGLYGDTVICEFDSPEHRCHAAFVRLAYRLETIEARLARLEEFRDVTMDAVAGIDL